MFVFANEHCREVSRKQNFNYIFFFLLLLYLWKQYDVHVMLVSVKQSRYRPGLAQRVPGS